MTAASTTITFGSAIMLGVEWIRRALGGHRTHQALRFARVADGRAEIHQRLVEVEDVTVGQHRARNLPEMLLGRTFLPVVALADEAAGQDARDVGVENGGSLAECEAHDGSGGVRADALERSQRLFIFRQVAVVLRDRFARDGMQAAWPDVVTERVPGLDDV